MKFWLYLKWEKEFYYRMSIDLFNKNIVSSSLQNIIFTSNEQLILDNFLNYLNLVIFSQFNSTDTVYVLYIEIWYVWSHDLLENILQNSSSHLHDVIIVLNYCSLTIMIYATTFDFLPYDLHWNRIAGWNVIYWHSYA